MRNKDFYDGDQANMYLSNSLIRVKDEPVYVLGINSRSSGLHIRFYETLAGDREDEATELPIGHKSIDMNPVPLGFCNIRYTFSDERTKDVIEIYRKPIRGYRIGLCRNNMSYDQVFGGENEYDPRNLLVCPELVKTIKGIYPKYEETLKYVTNEMGLVQAFGRRFAIQNMGGTINLLYSKSKTPVGTCDRRGPHLFDTHKYLQEALMEVVK